MVQVDVFWSYAIGAGTALAAGRQLRQRAREKASAAQPDSFADNPWFTKTVLFLAVVFGPSGAYLLWQFTSWETMHAGDRSLPAWLVTGFVVTNVTQGILGFVVTRHLLLRGRGYLAFLQVVLGYFCMFFVLAHGWDGTGYQRFFSSRPEALASWSTADIGRWFTSDVFLTLVGMGVVLVPVLVGMMVRWTRAGYELGGDLTPARPAARLLGAPALVGVTLLTVFGAGLGSAVVATVLLIVAGPVVGTVAFVPLVWFAGLRRGGLIERLARWWAIDDADLAARATRASVGAPRGPASVSPGRRSGATRADRSQSATACACSLAQR